MASSAPLPDSPALSSSTGIGAAVLAGLISAIVGFTSSFAVVLAGLRAVGASSEQSASGLLVLCLIMGAGCVIFSLLTRMPITMSWSTPGAALLASAAVPAGGFGAAVGAFLVCGLGLAACGVIRPLGRAVQAIPAPLASAMLAGVLLPLVTAPFPALMADAAAILPPIIIWLLMLRLAPRWAVPASLLAAIAVMAVRGSFAHADLHAAAPALVGVMPQLQPAALAAIALPLFIVTMTSQNIPGIAVLASFGYRPSFRAPLGYAGAASAVGALAGGHAINLAAISASLAAGPEAGPDPRRRWVAGLTCGVAYMALGPLAGVVTALAAAAPEGLIESIAALALLGTFATAAHGALDRADMRIPGALAVVVGASGIVIGGIGAAFWSLAAGLAAWAVLRRGRR